MPFRALVEGEKWLFGLIGANVTLDGARSVAERVHAKVAIITPFFDDILAMVQVAVGIATLVYMVFKIRRILRKGKEE